MPESVDKLARNIWGEARIAANLGPSPMDQDKHVERIKKSLAVHAEAIAGRMLKDLEKLKVGKLTRQLEIANDEIAKLKKERQELRKNKTIPDALMKKITEHLEKAGLGEELTKIAKDSK